MAVQSTPIPTPVSVPEPFRFLDLPKAIRLCIYEYLPVTVRHVELPYQYHLNEPSFLNIEEDTWVTCVVKTMSLSILSTCRFINDEASAILKPRLSKLCSRPPQLIYTVNSPPVREDGSLIKGAFIGYHLVLWSRILYDESLFDKIEHSPIQTGKSHIKPEYLVRHWLKPAQEKGDPVLNQLLRRKFLAHIQRRHSQHREITNNISFQVAVDGKALRRSEESNDEINDEIYMKIVLAFFTWACTLLADFARVYKGSPIYEGGPIEFVPMMDDFVAAGMNQIAHDRIRDAIFKAQSSRREPTWKADGLLFVMTEVISPDDFREGEWYW
ncbi:hypothetical protein DM02DRAFT_670079 [Periconia macrospinosa]|uniref:Uncharacterized protein n=1 Tax=Periconia macrospinosa TaxID=97972 RepID=A0A2V1DY54_9PLEO|nr:hypothetical protein DM02DRAFT_670079 [Periconia macrospinosa]